MVIFLIENTKKWWNPLICSDHSSVACLCYWDLERWVVVCLGRWRWPGFHLENRANPRFSSHSIDSKSDVEEFRCVLTSHFSRERSYLCWRFGTKHLCFQYQHVSFNISQCNSELIITFIFHFLIFHSFGIAVEFVQTPFLSWQKVTELLWSLEATTAL